MLDARQWDARYGWDLLAEYAAQFDSYIAITSPRAWAAVEHLIPVPPRHLEFQQGMGAKYLDALLPRIPDADLVLGIGGGNALDVAKIVAWKSGKPLILIPTIVSTGSIFQPLTAIRRTETWDFQDVVSPEYVLFDYGVIRSADPRYNRAGMGECICNLANVGAWKWWDAQGLGGPVWDENAAQITTDWVEQRATRFSADLDENGQPGETGIRIAAEVNRERYDLPTWHEELRHGTDHVFVTAFQWVHGREVLHSEGVALGTLISNYVYDWRFEEAKVLLDSCGVAYRPREIGCTIAEVHEVLARMNELNDRLGHSKNWFHHRQLDDVTFEQMMAKIEA